MCHSLLLYISRNQKLHLATFLIACYRGWRLALAHGISKTTGSRSIRPWLPHLYRGVFTRQRSEHIHHLVSRMTLDCTEAWRRVSVAAVSTDPQPWQSAHRRRLILKDSPHMNWARKCS